MNGQLPDLSSECETERQAAELAALRRMLDASRGCFSLSFAICNSPALRTHLIEEIRSSNPGIDVVVVSTETADVFGSVAVSIRAADRTALFVVGLEESLDSTKTRQPALASLNASRELWEQRFPYPVVFWLPDFAVTLVSSQARDFWRYRSHRFEFVSEQAGLSAAIDDALAGDFAAAGSLTVDERHFRIAELESRLTQVGPDPPTELAQHFLLWISELSFLYRSLARFDEAEAAARRHMTFAKHLGRADQIGKAQNAMGLLSQEKGDLDDALKSFREAERIARTVFGDNHPNVATCVNNIGRALKAKGDLDGALQCYREAERNARTACGDNHPHVAACVNNIGSVLHDKGDLDAALKCYRDAERIDRDAYGDNHPEVATDVNNIGSVLWAKDDLDGAMKCYREAERIARAAYGDNHPTVAIRVNNIGIVLHDKGDLHGAMKCHREAERIDRAAYGDTHPAVARDVNNIGSVLQDKGDLDGALKYYREAECIDRAAYGDDHPEVATDVNNIGSVLRVKGNLDGARERYREAFGIFLTTEGPQSPSTLTCARNLVELKADPVALAREIAGNDVADQLAAALRDLPPR